MVNLDKTSQSSLSSLLLVFFTSASPGSYLAPSNDVTAVYVAPLIHIKSLHGNTSSYISISSISIFILMFICCFNFAPQIFFPPPPPARFVFSTELPGHWHDSFAPSNWVEELKLSRTASGRERAHKHSHIWWHLKGTMKWGKHRHIIWNDACGRVAGGKKQQIAAGGRVDKLIKPRGFRSLHLGFESFANSTVCTLNWETSRANHKRTAGSARTRSVLAVSPFPPLIFLPVLFFSKWKWTSEHLSLSVFFFFFFSRLISDAHFFTPQLATVRFDV